MRAGLPMAGGLLRAGVGSEAEHYRNGIQFHIPAFRIVVADTTS